MKCPNCGKEIAEDYLYCGYCGKEITMVPEFEPEVEQEINTHLSGIAESFPQTTGSLPIQIVNNSGFSFRKYVALISGIVTIILLLLILLLRSFLEDRRHAEPPPVQGGGEETEVAVTPEEAVSDVPLPLFEPQGGSYGSGVTVILNKAAEGEIYYTINSAMPTELSSRYTAPIELREAGRYVIRAVFADAEGTLSAMEQQVYEVERPAAPVIMEQSGEYTQNTLIVAMAGANCSIFYTDDGSMPSGTSKRYLSPIQMPQGNSRFKFIAVDADGNMSDVTEREYHLTLAAVLSPEEAVQRLMMALVNNELIKDVEGHVEGMPGKNIYMYEGVVEVPSAGQYYKVNELYLAPDGSTTPTGAIFAINTHDGKVSRFGYDTKGNITLFGLR